MDNYEQFVGPIHPGQFKQSSAELQKSLREIQKLLESDSAHVDFSVSHDTLTPEEISKLLQLQPSYTLRDGDTIHKDERHHLTAKWTRWCLSSLDNVSYKCPVEKHLEWILDQLFGKLPAIRALQNQGARTKFIAHLEPWSKVIGIDFDIITIQRLAQLRIPLEFIVVHQNQEPPES